MRRWLSALALATLTVVVGAPSSAAAHASDALLNAHITAAARTLDPRVGATMRRIEGGGRRLLALRSYLRAGDGLPARWSWTTAEIRAYEGSTEQGALAEAIMQVRAAFERQQPGYSLFVQSAVRSLDVQIGRWNSNPSVVRVAEAFRDAVAVQVRREPVFRNVTRESTRRFVALVRDEVPDSAPTLAAPGLSRHGQMRAVDFIVRRGDEIVAGADSSVLAERWQRDSWSERLHAAVIASGAPFDGPLQQPPEPWHYEYRPVNASKSSRSR